MINTRQPLYHTNCQMETAFLAFSATFRPDLYTLKQLQMYLISLIFRSATPGSEAWRNWLRARFCRISRYSLFIILPRIPYLSATIIAIRDLPEFFRICEPVIQSPQILFAQRMYPAVFPDQLHTKLPVPVIFLQNLAQKFTHVRNLCSHMACSIWIRPVRRKLNRILC